MKITIVGIGYVGLSLATLLSQKYEVVAFDLLPEKVNMVNKRKSFFKDEYIDQLFNKNNLKLTATLDEKEAFENSNYIIICTPTNYNEKQRTLDTSSVENVIRKVVNNCNQNVTIVIKSTVPIGFTDTMRKKYNFNNIFFSPEFLREDKALYDNLYPSRIIIGERNDKASEFASVLNACAQKDNITIRYMTSKEAEAVKLFSNAFLALRLSFFNELDMFSEIMNLDSRNIIEGLCDDPRIGDYYNNPSFGYGGYCLPKDIKQLLNDYQNIPESLIDSTIKSNSIRKQHIVNMILLKKPKVIGIYRLNVKKDSDNFRNSAIIDIITLLKEENKNIIIYEPLIKESDYEGLKIEKTLSDFKAKSDIIIANRYDDKLNDVKEKVYTRDLFYRD